MDFCLIWSAIRDMRYAESAVILSHSLTKASQEGGVRTCAGNHGS